jgi:hypothetical protein
MRNFVICALQQMLKVKVKCKDIHPICLMLNYEPRHEDVLGNECMAPRIPNLGIRWR